MTLIAMLLAVNSRGFFIDFQGIYEQSYNSYRTPGGPPLYSDMTFHILVSIDFTTNMSCWGVLGEMRLTIVPPNKGHAQPHMTPRATALQTPNCLSSVSSCREPGFISPATPPATSIVSGVGIFACALHEDPFCAWGCLCKTKTWKMYWKKKFRELKSARPLLDMEVGHGI